MDPVVRSRLVAKFITTARSRVEAAMAAVGTEDGPKVAQRELHALAGEAAIIGFSQLAEVARTGERAAKDWGASGEVSSQLQSARAIRSLLKQITGLETETAGSPPPAPATSVARVLVVDDSAIVGERICSELRGRGVEAEHIASHADALSALQTAPADLVLVDLHMPTVDESLAFIETVESLPGGPRVAVMSGMAQAEMTAAMSAFPTVRCVSKLDGIEALVSVVLVENG